MPASRMDDKYSAGVGTIFLFNLIVGTGALALPGALQKAGWVIGVILLLVLAAVSFITVTFIVEALAVANAVSRKRYGEATTTDMDTQDDRQRLIPQPSNSEVDAFDITEKYELGQIGVLVTPRWCQVIIYTCLCCYLFGDLAIYAVVFGKTWATILCHHTSAIGNSNGTEVALCFKNSNLSVLSIYRISIAIFIVVMGPFTFFNLQKTKILQIVTIITRILAFSIMLAWCIMKLSKGGKQGEPVLVDFKALPTLFGTLVYSYMCQHSIPGLIQPIRDKQRIKFIVPFDFSVITIFYLSLCFTAIYTFKEVEDLYTINFWNETSRPGTPIVLIIISYFLALFPIFSVSTTYPILAITLRNNFRAMILRDAPKIWYYDYFLFPLVIILPPTGLAIAISDLHLLVGFIGSYCGTCVQYLIPCILVSFARNQMSINDNPFASPFRSKGWVYAVYVWMSISLVIITINFLRNAIPF